MPAVPDVLPILSGSTELAGVGEVQFFVDQDTVYVVDEKIEVCSSCSLQPFISLPFNSNPGALRYAFCKVHHEALRGHCRALQALWPCSPYWHEMIHRCLACQEVVSKVPFWFH
jgi:hypothetical protein